MRKLPSFILAALVLVLGITAVELFDARHELKDDYLHWKQGPVPTTVTRSEFLANNTAPADAPEEDVMVEEDADEPEVPETDPAVELERSYHPDVEENPPLLNLYVPFVVQSPFAEWTDVDQEACEEASMLMLKGYLDDTASFTPEEIREAIDGIVAYENETFGYFEDTTATETVAVMRDYLGMDSARAIPILSLDEIRDRIASGTPVMLPAYGRALGNPYFSNDGPLFHMLVAKGYTATHIIVNDPGTKRGEDFLYENEILWNALGDWNDGDPEHGAKVMIVAE